MTDRRRRRVASLVVALAAAVAGVAIYVEVTRPLSSEQERAFTGEAPEVWPPAADTSLDEALTSTERVTDPASLDAGSRDAGSLDAAGADAASLDAGVLLGREGVLVRSGTLEGLYYIEAVFGEGAAFDDRLPMAVLMHGRGDRARVPGGIFAELGAPLRVIVPQAPDPLGDGFEWLPVRVGSGMVDRLTTALLARVGHVARFLRAMLGTLPSVGRPMVMGFSQGGILSLALAVHHSDVVEVAFPLAAWLPPAFVPAYRRDDVRFPRIRSLHGTSDPVIPLEPTRVVFETLQVRGFEAELVEIDGAGHEMTEAMNEQLHRWLQEALGVVVRQAVADGILDGGSSCPPPDGGVPEAGVPDGGWPCPARDAGRLDAGHWDAGHWDAGRTLDAGPPRRRRARAGPDAARPALPREGEAPAPVEVEVEAPVEVEAEASPAVDVAPPAP